MKIEDIEDIKALYYALGNAHQDVMSAGLVSSANNKICFYMNDNDYCVICGLLYDQVLALDNGKKTLFGHEIKIRHELKHIYLGIEMEEVE